MFVVPVLLIVKLVLMPFERPMKRSAEEVARYLRDFLEKSGGDWDWDDFISIPIADPRLEALRDRAAKLALPMADADTGPLQALVSEAEAIAASERTASLTAAAS
jgi:hypothetical protein